MRVGRPVAPGGPARHKTPRTAAQLKLWMQPCTVDTKTPLAIQAVAVSAWGIAESIFGCGQLFGLPNPVTGFCRSHGKPSPRRICLSTWFVLETLQIALTKRTPEIAQNPQCQHVNPKQGLNPGNGPDPAGGLKDEFFRLHPGQPVANIEITPA